jgi:hypothetical protein
MSEHRIRTLLTSSTIMAAAFALVVPATTASASAQPSTSATVEITVDGAGIHAPQTLPPGVTTFHTSSTVPGVDSMAAVRLNDGVSYDRIYGYLRDGDLASVFQHVTGEGGIAHSGPHNGGRWTTTLTRGDYLFVDDEAGLVAPFQVRGPRTHAKRPDDSGTVKFENGTFRLPADFGDGTWRFKNGDTLQHGLGLVHVAPGHSRAEVSAAIANHETPDWVEPQGTLNILGSGESAWLTIRDLHGLYVVVDYLPAIQGAASGPVVQFVSIA